MKGLRIGHYTQEDNGTGASVFLFDKPAVGAYCLCGSSPATHELETLDLDTNVTHVDGLALLGGSAFGLASVIGVMRWFQEQERGWPTPHGLVPIVPAAAIYDLAFKKPAPPSAEEVYQACVSARVDNDETGRIGAGTGASIGKVVQNARRMSGGIGHAEMHLANGVSVLAYAVVNAVGDIRNEQGEIIAGAAFEEGNFADCEKHLLACHADPEADAENTTLVAIFTDAQFTQVELKRIAKMAVAGMGRAIAPIFTRYDGDLVFSFSLGDKLVPEIIVGTAAAHLVQKAIMNAVKNSVVIE